MTAAIEYQISRQDYFTPEALAREIRAFVDYYNNRRYHESLDNLPPADVFFGRDKEVRSRRDKIKRDTLAARRLMAQHASISAHR